jgi:CRISPR-associated protein Csm1
MTSEKENCIRALAGLLHNPKCVSEIKQIVPEHWRDEIRQYIESSFVKDAARLAAGLQNQEQASTSNTDKLISIFCSLHSEGSRAPKALYWPSTELQIKRDVLFPVEDKDGAKAMKDVWAEFLERATTLRDVYEGAGDEALPCFIENLMLLMQRYLWSMPCGLKSLPDVSIYDHSRMTAALAALESRDILLLGGDISGLQDFIYTISADGAASALRGRSFYLQLLNEVLPRLILQTLNLPMTNLIYAGGGNFYLFMSSADQIKLNALRERLSKVLLAHHHGELYLALASIALKEDDFLGGEISNRWRDVGSALQRIKQRRFSELGDGLKDLFLPQGRGGNEVLQCRVCGLEHSQTKDRSAENKPRICPPCEEFEELGRDLRKAQYLALRYIKAGSVPDVSGERGTWIQVLRTLGFQVVIGPEDRAPKIEGAATLFALKDENTSRLNPRTDLAVGRRYFVNVTPIVQRKDINELKEKKFEEELRPDTVKPFDALQEQATGLKRLGVLRMDVDNLGNLFSKGLESPCLARIASLSFAVSLYFEGWVEYLAEERNKKDGKDRLYSIYSGGDDLFFVGSWDAVIELAREIRRDLTSYAANHPEIHASAGIALIGGKYPLYQAARDAGSAEEKAKAFVNAKGEMKNAITFLGQTIDWELFGTDDCGEVGTHKVHALMHQLESLLKPKESPRALLGILMDLQEKFSVEANRRQLEGSDKNKRGEKQVLFGPWQWLGFYYLKRMIRREQSRNQNFAKKVEEITSQLQQTQFSNIEWIGLSARWAELLLRNGESTGDRRNS